VPATRSSFTREDSVVSVSGHLIQVEKPDAVVAAIYRGFREHANLKEHRVGGNRRICRIEGAYVLEKSACMK
jgi:hypothetical protein